MEQCDHCGNAITAEVFEHGLTLWKDEAGNKVCPSRGGRSSFVLHYPDFGRLTLEEITCDVSGWLQELT